MVDLESCYNGFRIEFSIVKVGDGINFEPCFGCVNEFICGASLRVYCDRSFARGEPMDE